MEVEGGEGHGATSSSGPIWARSVFREFIPNTPLEAEVTGKRGLRRRRLASEPSAGSDVDSIRANRLEQKNVGSRHGVSCLAEIGWSRRRDYPEDLCP